MVFDAAGDLASTVKKKLMNHGPSNALSPGQRQSWLGIRTNFCSPKLRTYEFVRTGTPANSRVVLSVRRKVGRDRFVCGCAGIDVPKVRATTTYRCST